MVIKRRRNTTGTLRTPKVAKKVRKYHRWCRKEGEKTTVSTRKGEQRLKAGEIR